MRREARYPVFANPQSNGTVKSHSGNPEALPLPQPRSRPLRGQPSACLSLPPCPPPGLRNPIPTSAPELLPLTLVPAIAHPALRLCLSPPPLCEGSCCPPAQHWTLPSLSWAAVSGVARSRLLLLLADSTTVCDKSGVIKPRKFGVCSWPDPMAAWSPGGFLGSLVPNWGSQSRAAAVLCRRASLGAGAVFAASREIEGT